MTGLRALLLGAQLIANGAAASGMPPPTVEIVVYSDFQCPFCRQFARPTAEIRAKGLNGIPATITFKHFPLAFHANAPLAHQAAEAAKAQGKFWEMHDLLFANSARLERSDLLGYARALSLDLARFETDLDSVATKQAVATDIAEGRRAGITATPSYLINGKLYEGARTMAQLGALLSGRSPDPGFPLPDPAPRIPSRSRTAEAGITETMLSSGPADAPVTIELFADLQSPLTHAALGVVEAMHSTYPGRVRVQFRSNPLPFHPQALLAHEAAMAAAHGGRFWEFIRAVLSRQSSLREDDLVELAGRLGLDTTEFRAALGDHRYRARVDADRDDASRRGLRGSPAVVVNGIRLDGVPSRQVLAATINAALAELRRHSGTGG